MARRRSRGRSGNGGGSVNIVGILFFGMVAVVVVIVLWNIVIHNPELAKDVAPLYKAARAENEERGDKGFIETSVDDTIEVANQGTRLMDKAISPLLASLDRAGISGGKMCGTAFAVILTVFGGYLGLKVGLIKIFFDLIGGIGKAAFNRSNRGAILLLVCVGGIVFAIVAGIATGANMWTIAFLVIIVAMVGAAVFFLYKKIDSGAKALTEWALKGFFALVGFFIFLFGGAGSVGIDIVGAINQARGMSTQAVEPTGGTVAIATAQGVGQQIHPLVFIFLGLITMTPMIISAFRTGSSSGGGSSS